MKSSFRIISLTLSLSLVCISSSPSKAATITTTNQVSVATAVPFPDNVGTHTHSSVGTPVEVGTYQTGEVVYGVAEFNLTGTLPAPTTALRFVVNQLGSSYFGQSGPGSYTINVVAYAGDNNVTIADSSAPATAMLGSFNTSSLTPGQILTFNASSAFTAAQLGSGSLGVRLEPATNPGNNVANQFTSFTLITVPEPSTVCLLGASLAGMVFLFRRRFATGAC